MIDECRELFEQVIDSIPFATNPIVATSRDQIAEEFISLCIHEPLHVLIKILKRHSPQFHSYEAWQEFYYPCIQANEHDDWYSIENDETALPDDCEWLLYKGVPLVLNNGEMFIRGLTDIAQMQLKLRFG